MSKEYMFARVILASTTAFAGVPTLYTLHLRYPRIFHAELMTHRVFSRNARSSRAVPIMTMIREVWGNPFVPWHWGKNQKGMQASEDISGWRRALGRKVWIAASKAACIGAYALHKLGFHKQIANRLLEPFSFIDVLVSATDWANFIHLRDHKDAEPHFHDLAGMIREAMDGAYVQKLSADAWHLPYVTDADVDLVEDYLEPYPETTHKTTDYLLKLSVARCARISYTPFDGNASIEAELDRYEKLVGSSPLHASPAEHQATPDTMSTYRKDVKIFESPKSETYDLWKTEFKGNEFNNARLAGNFAPGWIQYRKTLKGEYVANLAA